MPLLVISLAGLIVMSGSAVWELRRKGEMRQKARWWISSAIGLSGVLYATYVSLTLIRFFPPERVVLSIVLGVGLGIAFLSLMRRRTRQMKD